MNMNGNGKTKVAVIVVGTWSLIVLLGGMLYIWASPTILTHVPTLPPGELKPGFLPGHLAIPLLIILGAIVIRKTRRSAVRILLWGLAFFVASIPSYQVIMAIRATDQLEAVGRMRLASAMLLYCISLAVLLGLKLIAQVMKINKQAEQCPPPLPYAPAGHKEGEG